MEVYDRVTTFEGVAALLIVIGVKVRLLELESAEPEAGHLKKLLYQCGTKVPQTSSQSMHSRSFQRISSMLFQNIASSIPFSA